MNSHFLKIPAPNALVVFEASARHLSFTKAAMELCVSQAAVSKQVANLEDRLGVQLFVRSHRALSLTTRGRVLYEAVSQGLSTILEAVHQITEQQQNPTVTISATTAFIQLWLLPRLALFKQQHPDIDLRLITSDDNRTPLESGVDIAIKYGDDSWRNVHSTFLLANEVLPVCSPQLVQGQLTLEQLLELPLLDLDGQHWRWVHWQTWLLSQDVRQIKPKVGLEFNNIPILYQAAQAGQGVALGWTVLVQDLIDKGLLVVPCDCRMALPEPWAYYMLQPSRDDYAPAVRRVQRWLLAAIRGLEELD